MVNFRGAGGDDVGGVEVLVESVGLAGVDHEKHFVIAIPPFQSALAPRKNTEKPRRHEGGKDIPLLLPHLLKRIRQIPTPNLLTVLKLQKLIPPMSRHVHQHITAPVTPQPLPPRHILPQPIRQQPDEVLHRDLVPAVVHLDVVAVQVERAVGVVVDGAREGVARVAGHVVGEHEEDLRVRDPEPLDRAVEREHVGQVPVVEPEARGGDQDGPVGGVGAEGGGEEQGEEGQGEEGEGWELHFWGRREGGREGGERVLRRGWVRTGHNE